MNKILFILLVIIVTLIPEVKSQDSLILKIGPEKSEKVIGQEPEFVFVDVNAKFQDAGLERFREWVQKNLVYPPIAVENGVQGTVVAQFCINSKGKLVNSKILRSVDPLLDKEVLRVINSSPDWTPALYKGQPVMQQFNMPVIFGLTSNKKERK